MNEKNIYYQPFNPIPYPQPNNQFNDITERINRLERQLKRIDQRLTRIETPYNNKDYNTDLDNNMYIM